MAAHVWESKPFHTWTDKELEKVLTSSPWAGKASVTYVRSRPQPIQEQAIVTWASAQVIRQALAREEFGATPQLPRDVEAIIARTPSFYIVTVRISKGANSAGHAGQAEMMRNETFLQLRGKPSIPAVQAEGEVIGQDGKPLQALDRSDGLRGTERASGPMATPVLAQRAGGGGAAAGGQRGAGSGAAGQRGSGRGNRGGFGVPAGSSAGSLVVFRFPRDPITLGDKEVEFVTRLCSSGGGAQFLQSSPGVPQFNAAGAAQRGPPPDIEGILQAPRSPVPACNYNVKKKFKLKDMLVKGGLAL
jgi:hypothetical protein